MIDLELLKQAWPKGYLAMRGVCTVGNWICTGSGWVPIDPDAHGDPYLLLHPPPESAAHKHVRDGDLLPNVDPADVATWACLLEDLVQAVDLTVPEKAHIELSRCRDLATREPHWRIIAAGMPVEGLQYSIPFSGIDTDDPALALVFIRIGVREQREK